MNYLTEARRALVDWLRQDPGLRDFVRSWYDYGEKARQPFDAVAADCPAVEIGPAANPLSWATNASVDEQYRLVARLHVRGFDIAAAEEFAVMYKTSVWRGDEANFYLPASNGLYRTDILDTAFERTAESVGEDAEQAVLRHIGWRVVTPTTLVFRRDPTLKS